MSCVHVCMRVYCTCVCVRACVRVCVCVHACVCVSMYCLWMSLHAHLPCLLKVEGCNPIVSLYVTMSFVVMCVLCVCACVCMHLYMCVHVCTYMCVYIAIDQVHLWPSLIPAVHIPLSQCMHCDPLYILTIL